MRKITGAFFQSLDGVIQAPGGPPEDPSGGFPFGGWMPAVSDDAVMAAVGELFAPPYALLLGRRTYDIFAAYWPYVEGGEAEMGAALTAAEKHVLTRGDQPLEWANSHRLADLDAAAVLKASMGPDLLIQGSGALYPALLDRGLIDRLVVMTLPIVLGRGKRAFGEGTPPRTLRLVSHTAGPKATIATYEPAGAVELGAFGAAASAREDARQQAIAAGRW